MAFYGRKEPLHATIPVKHYQGSKNVCFGRSAPPVDSKNYRSADVFRRKFCLYFTVYTFTNSCTAADGAIGIDMTDLVLDFGERISLNMGKPAINVQANCSFSEDEEEKVTLLSLHDDVFQEILSHLHYDEIAKLRLVERFLACWMYS